MQTFGGYLGCFLLLVILAGLGLWFWGPFEKISVVPNFKTAAIGADVDAYFADRESRFDDITPGTEKRVIWRTEAGAKTPLAIVYVHGFSATSEEIRPVPDQIAAQLGANLVYTRLRGHGRPGSALPQATVLDWMNDFAEAVEVGRRIGGKVIVIATSTGATLLAEAAVQPELIRDVAGAVMISPNFRIKAAGSQLLTLPAARYWGPLVAGKTRSWDGRNEAHSKFWTTSYPTTGLLQMAALVQHARAVDYAGANLSALFWFSDLDAVVDHQATRAIAADWGGAVTIINVSPKQGDDPNNHVVAGNILSPGQNSTAIREIVNWINDL